IRDKLVTGVQTCALPICPGAARPTDRATRCLEAPGLTSAIRPGGVLQKVSTPDDRSSAIRRHSLQSHPVPIVGTPTTEVRMRPRSEERRVGKGGGASEGR